MISARLRRLLSSWQISTLSTLSSDCTLITSLITVTQSYSAASSARYRTMCATSSSVFARPRAASPMASLLALVFCNNSSRCSMIWMKNCWITCASSFWLLTTVLMKL